MTKNTLKIVNQPEVRQQNKPSSPPEKTHTTKSQEQS